MIYPDDLLQLRQVTRSCTKVAVATRNMKKLRSKSWNRADVATPIAGWKKPPGRSGKKNKTSSYDGWYICYVYSMDYHLLSMIIYGISMHVTSFHHKWVSLSLVYIPIFHHLTHHQSLCLSEP